MTPKQKLRFTIFSWLLVLGFSLCLVGNIGLYFTTGKVNWLLVPGQVAVFMLCIVNLLVMRKKWMQH